jgi:amino acid permease
MNPLVYCIKCGEEQADTAKFCTKCGAKMPTSSESIGTDNSESFEKKIEKKAEAFGKKAERFGNRFEKKADAFGTHFNHWYDETFGILGPLIGAFISLIVIRIIIYVIQAASDEIFIFTALGQGLYNYLIFIFISILISSYNTYLNRKYHQQYLFIYPFIGAIGFIIGFWVLAQILLFVNQSNVTPIFATIGEFINTYLIVFFALAIIIGYITQFTYNDKK